jgi:cytochrome c-type biogenesis protein CcmF
MNLISSSGERLWAGQLGHALVLLSFLSACFSFFLFISKIKNTRPLADRFFKTHFFLAWSIALLLIFMLFNGYFEYQYIWQHSNKEMDMKYVLSCLWEGQEGSFLLWICWNALLGTFYLKISKEDFHIKSFTMAAISLIQVFLTSMILGVYIGDYRLGSSPFLLLKQHPDFMNLPFLMNEDYLKNLDGRGLNPLLMNYWMVIHPPVLFLGFSFSMFPFAQILARLLLEFEAGWHHRVLPWLWAGVAVLGAGILMGGAWAYESLSFGGFWAWDPVENSSLVPWMMLAAGGHMILIDQKRNKGFVAGIFIAAMSFIFVLYSTFLTRSGILGNASVHSFTDLGMQGQLLAYLFVFFFLFVLFFIPKEKNIYKILYFVVSLYAFVFSGFYDALEYGMNIYLLASVIFLFYSGFDRAEKRRSYQMEFLSREFHLYMGAMVFFVLSLLIIFLTSLPVINRLAGTAYAMPRPMDYSLLAMPFAVVVLLMMGYAQWMKYKKDDLKTILKKTKWPWVLTALVAFSTGIPLFFTGNADAQTLQHKILFFTLFLVCMFDVFSNALAGRSSIFSKIKQAGSYLSHVGFGLLILGALVSVSKKSVISKNATTTDLRQLGKDYNNETASLLKQNDTVPLGPYLAVYSGKRREGMNVYFRVDFFENYKGERKKSFTLHPKVQDNPKMGKASDPDTKHYIHKDIYTYVSYADLSMPAEKESKENFGESKNFIAHLKDTIVLNNALAIPDSLYFEKTMEKSDTILKVYMKMKIKNDITSAYDINPYLVIKNQSIFSDFYKDTTSGIMVNFWKINPQDASFEFLIREDEGRKKDFIVLEAIIFPGINLLWLGCLIMVVGVLITVISGFNKING